MAKRAKRTSRRAQGSSGRSKTTYFLIGGGIIIAVVLLGALLFLSLQPTPEIAGLVTFPRPARGHDNTVSLPPGELPPAGGVHHDVWQNCGIYDEPIGAENAVHSLEHGAVWVTYQPDLPVDQIAALEEQVRGVSFVLLSPYPEQRSPVVLTAWGLQLEVEGPDDERIGEFIDRYRVGPQTPERGAACTGGVGEPVA